MLLKLFVVVDYDMWMFENGKLLAGAVVFIVCGATSY